MAKYRRARGLMGLGEPITAAVVGIPWLYVVAGAWLGRMLLKPKDTLTVESLERAQVLGDALRASQNGWFMQAAGSWGTQGVDEQDLEAFVASNASLLDPASYASGKAPTAEQLKQEIRAIVQVAMAQGAGSFKRYSRMAATLQGGYTYGD